MMPTDSPEEVFLKCIMNYTQDKKERLSLYTNEVVRISKLYEEKAFNTTLHTMEIQEEEDGRIKGSKITASEIKKVYKDKFVSKGEGGRPYYDRLMSMPRFGKCPFCGIRDVSTLDHYLPKSKYPALSITLINLVPACSDCNQRCKKQFIPKSSEEEILHPYFDNVENEIWLEAEVVEVLPIAFRFSVKNPDEWDDLKRKRVIHHFSFFKLDQLYSIKAAEEFIGCQGEYLNIFKIGGIQELKEGLVRRKDSYEKINLNSYQSAMYRALVNSEWFYDTGLIELSKWLMG